VIANRGKWPARAIAKVQQAVDEWQQTFPDYQVFPRIAWGFANKEEEEKEAKLPRKKRLAEALLDFNDHTFEIALQRIGPDSPDWCYIDTHFSSWPEFETDELPDLPLGDARKLFNVLNDLMPGVQLIPVPIVADPEEAGSDPEEAEDLISVLGVRTFMPVEALSARVLANVLSNLEISAQAVWNWLALDQGDDEWPEE
jgi:hypothetical protein